MSSEQLKLVGWIKDAHGIKGELFIVLAAGQAEWDLDETSLFIRAKGEETARSFEVESLSPHKNGLIAAVAGIDDRNQAETLKGAEIFIPAEALVSKAGERIFLGEVLGFEVLDEQLGTLGLVTAFRSNGPQDLLVVESEQGEIELPLIDEFLVRLDFSARKVVMRLPDGLVEAMRGA